MISGNIFDFSTKNPIKNISTIFSTTYEHGYWNLFMREGSQESFPCQNSSADPFAMILVPLERGGLRRHFELLSVEIHRRSSEKSSLEVGQVVIFWTLGSLKNVHKRCNLKKNTLIIMTPPERKGLRNVNIF